MNNSTKNSSQKKLVVLGSLALTTTLVLTSAGILAAKNFLSDQNNNSNPYSRYPVGKFFAQSFALGSKNPEQFNDNVRRMSQIDKLMEQGNHFEDNKNYRQALDQYTRALAIVKEYPGIDSAPGLKILDDKAACEDKLGLLDDEESTLTQALDASEKTFNSMHSRVADELESLGDLLSKEDRHDKAVPLFLRAYDIRAKGENETTSEIAYTMTQLGNSYLELKQFEKADEFYEKAITAYVKLDDNGFSEAQRIARENLSNSYRWQSRDKEALELEKSVLADLEKRNMGKSQYAALTYVAMADTEGNHDDWAKMKQYIEQAQNIADSLNGTTFNKERADIYDNIASVYHDYERYKDELPALQKAQQYCKEIPGNADETREKLADNYVRSGACALKLKNYKLAHEYYGLALSQARGDEEIRLALKDKKEQIEEYINYIENIESAPDNSPSRLQATELKQMLLS